MKKFISILLTASMLASMVAVTASAEENEVLFGDVNSDGVIDAKDASLILEDYAEVLFGHESMLSADIADINQDGTINSVDSSYILQYAGFCIVKGDNICTLKEFPSSKERNDYFKKLAYKEYKYEYDTIDYSTFSDYYDEYESNNLCMTEIDYAEYKYYCDNYDSDVDPDKFLSYAHSIASKNAFNLGYDVIAVDELDSFFEYTSYLTSTYGVGGWNVDKNFRTSTEYQDFLKTRETK